jgi:hypothetical protein
MFVRIKNIKRQNYAYLVENRWTANGARQKVSRYLGRVVKPEKKTEKSAKEHLRIEDVRQYINDNDFKKIINDLVAVELFNHGVRNFDYNRGVLQINDGFLCTHTINELLNYKGDDENGVRLAELITGAGIKIEKDLFISLFEKLKIKREKKIAEAAKNEFKDFYY